MKKPVKTHKYLPDRSGCLECGGWQDDPQHPHRTPLMKAKDQWNIELNSFRILSEQLVNLERELKKQQERVHVAYVEYQRLAERTK